MLQYFLFLICACECVTGFELKMERPQILYYNTQYIRFVNFTVRKLSRHSPYYANFTIDVVYPFGNNITVNARVLELLSSGQYNPMPFELKDYGVCDFFSNEKFVGQVMKKAMLKNFTCPIPAGVNHFCNVVPNFDNFPYHIPFIWEHLMTINFKVEISTNFRDELFLKYIFFGSITQRPKKETKRKT